MHFSSSCHVLVTHPTEPISWYTTSLSRDLHRVKISPTRSGLGCAWAQWTPCRNLGHRQTEALTSNSNADNTNILLISMSSCLTFILNFFTHATLPYAIYSFRCLFHCVLCLFLSHLSLAWHASYFCCLFPLISCQAVVCTFAWWVSFYLVCIVYSILTGDFTVSGFVAVERAEFPPGVRIDVYFSFFQVHNLALYILARCFRIAHKIATGPFTVASL